MLLLVPIYRDEAISRDCHTEFTLSGGLAMTDAESVNKLFLGSLRRVFRNVVQGFSLVRHGPEGSHYKIWR